MPSALVRGLGDIGSAVAHRLFSDAYRVVIHDAPRPTTTRRRMAFADAAFDGVATLAGVEARRASDLTTIPDLLARQLVAVYLGPFDPLLAILKPDVLVDARMRKRNVPEDQRGLATLTVGLGPNFKVGVMCDVAVETSWDGLGALVRDGEPAALAGEPRELGGHARDRYVYAPHGGVFRTEAQIGDAVHAGQAVATIDGTVLTAPLTGVLRGLTHDFVPVMTGTKVIEVDPRGRAAEVEGIGERPRRIADGVMAAIRSVNYRARGIEEGGVLDGSAPVREVREALGLPIPDAPDYTTIAGFVLHLLQSVPTPGASVSYAGYSWTVVDMDGPRITKVKVRRVSELEQRKGDQADHGRGSHQDRL